MERNITLDYFKILLCILVITIHIPPLFSSSAIAGWLISNGIARIAVPCFFIINGYYIYSKISNWKSILRYLYHLITIYITWTFIYVAFYWDNLSGITFIYLFSGLYHLWYLPALIGGVLLLFLCKKIIRNNYIILIVALLLFLTGYFIQNYCFWTSMSGIRMLSYRNALFMGFPFIFFGYFIRKFDQKVILIPALILIVVLIAGAIGLLYESSISFPNPPDFFLSLIIVPPVAFILILKYSDYKRNNGYIGSLSSGIYYTHFLAIFIMNALYPMEEMKIYILLPVLFLSIIMSVVIIELNKRIKIFL